MGIRLYKVLVIRTLLLLLLSSESLPVFRVKHLEWLNHHAQQRDEDQIWKWKMKKLYLYELKIDFCNKPHGDYHFYESFRKDTELEKNKNFAAQSFRGLTSDSVYIN